MSIRVFKDGDSTDTAEEYNKQINKFAREIAQEYYKGKRTLIITGSGISSDVPNMSRLMEKLKILIDSYDIAWQRSQVFIDIFNDCYNSKSRELHQKQSRLLTYIQNAYMGKTKYVDSADVEPLADIWSKFIIWLIYGDECKKNQALSMRNHQKITRLFVICTRK